MLRSYLSRLYRIIQDVARLLNYADRKLTWLVFAATVVETALAVASLFLIKRLVDSLSTEPPAGVGALVDNVIAGQMLAIAGFLILSRSFQSIASYLKQKQSLLVADIVNEEIQTRTCSADQSFFDGAVYFDALERAREAGPQRPAQVASNAFTTLRSIILLAGTAVVIAGLDWRILLGIALALGLALLVQLSATAQQFRWMKRRIQLERRSSYLDWLLTSELFSKEIRLFNVGEFFRSCFSNIRQTIRVEQLAIEWMRSRREIILAIIGGLVFVGSSWLLLVDVARGVGTLGDLVLFVIVFQRAETAGRAAVQSVARLYDDQLFLDQLFEFLRIEPSISSPGPFKQMPPTGRDGLYVDNVSFKYPRARKKALDGVTLHVPPGKFVALVGGNGSGKSTLIKLLCRLYDPQDGSITLENHNIQELDPREYRREFGVVFQEFARFAETAAENIRLGDVSVPIGSLRIIEAAKRARAHDFIESLPSGYDTMLSRIFDAGEELSGGQWQRIALARAFFPNARFLILDEPTSAIDAAAEEKLFRHLKHDLDGRGALVISHRLSTIRRADYTYVLDDGRMVEEGTHEELLQRRSAYYRMFEAQISANSLDYSS